MMKKVNKNKKVLFHSLMSGLTIATVISAFPFVAQTKSIETIATNNVSNKNVSRANSANDNVNSLAEIQKDFNSNYEWNETKVNFADGLPQTLDEILKYNQNEIIKSPKFDWRAYGIIPTSRDQKWTSLCWAFGLAGIIEANILKNNLLPQYNRRTIKVDPLNIDYTTNVRTDRFDKLDLTLDDVFSRKLNEGGYTRSGAIQLLQWNGPIQNDNQLSGPEQYHDPTYWERLGTPIALLDNIEMATITEGQPSKNLEYEKQIKELVVKYGAVGVSYFSGGNSTSYEYYNSNNVSSGSHQSIIVGWDDTISKNSFKYPASKDGAWIVRNTTATKDHLGDGCFFLSYDSPIRNILGVSLVSKQTYENNYYYDGCYSDVNDTMVKPTQEIAAIFPARKASYNKKEKIKAVNFGLSAPNVSGVVKIYRNLKNANINNRFDPANDPTNGSLVATKKFSFKNPGFYTVQLDKPIEISRNELFSVVVSIDNSVPKNAQQFWFTQEPNSYNDMTFYKENNQWKNCWGENKNLVAKIKAFTVTEVIPGAPTSSNDVDFADVFLDKRFWTYKSSESKPVPIVKLGDKILINNEDYQVEYKEYFLDKKHIEAKDNAVIGMGVVVIKGIGKYKGTNQNTQYNIRVAPRPDLGSIGTYDQTNKVNIEIGSGITNFNQIALPSCWKFAFPNDPINNQNHIEYIGNDTQFYRKTFFDVVIKKSSKNSISSAQIQLIDKGPFTYNGKEIKPNVIVSLNGLKLKINIDYSVEYLNNINVSKSAEIIVKGIGNYTGIVKTQFEITKAQNKINVVDGKLQADFGELKRRYYKDPQCTIEINSLEELPNNSKYWVKFYADPTENWTGVESQPIEQIYTSGQQPEPPVNPDSNDNNQEPKPPVVPDSNDNNQENSNNQVTNKNKLSKSTIVTISTVSSIAGVSAIGGALGWLIWKMRKK